MRILALREDDGGPRNLVGAQCLYLGLVLRLVQQQGMYFGVDEARRDWKWKLYIQIFIFTRILYLNANTSILRESSRTRLGRAIQIFSHSILGRITLNRVDQNNVLTSLNSGIAENLRSNCFELDAICSSSSIWGVCGLCSSRDRCPEGSTSSRNAATIHHQVGPWFVRNIWVAR